jgi:hypothetical protein
MYIGFGFLLAVRGGCHGKDQQRRTNDGTNSALLSIRHSKERLPGYPITLLHDQQYLPEMLVGLTTKIDAMLIFVPTYYILAVE